MSGPRLSGEIFKYKAELTHPVWGGGGAGITLIILGNPRSIYVAPHPYSREGEGKHSGPLVPNHIQQPQYTVYTVVECRSRIHGSLTGDL